MDPILSQPGFRFVPTEEELVGLFLTCKAEDNNYVYEAIGEVDFNQVEPWDLRTRAKKINDNTMFFFSRWDKKYPTGVRTNRATKAGYWKSTGKDRAVLCKGTGSVLGMKKTLVFYTGRAPKEAKTDWIMHEYRTGGKVPEHQKEWVVCRISKKSSPCTIIGSVCSDTTHDPQIEKPNTLPEQEYRGVSAIVAEDGETSRVRRSFSDMTRLSDLQLFDTLDGISGWDMGSPVPIWDIRAGFGSTLFDF